MKIAFVSTYDIEDIRNWSGTGYHIAQALRDESVDILPVGPLKEKAKWRCKLKMSFYRRFTKKRYLCDRNYGRLTAYAKQVAGKLCDLRTNLIFSLSTLPIAYLESEQPMAFWTDSAFAGMVNYYPNFSRLCRESLREGNRAEEAALRRCRLAIYSSDWAARTVMEHYKIEGAKIRVVPFGANLPGCPDLEGARACIAKRPARQCRLLFVGLDWERKGGPQALELLDILTRAGLDASLTVVGARPNLPAKDTAAPRVRFVDRISKTTPAGCEKIAGLIAESHFLVLPTRADCSPIILCEANAYAVPCLTTDVGGIPTIVRDGMNGKMFSPATFPQACATFILELFSDDARYRAMAESSFREYQLRLNWQTACRLTKKYLLEI